MDFSKVSQGELVAGAGGALLFVSLFAHWGGGLSGFHLFSDVNILMVVISLAVVLFMLAPALDLERPVANAPTVVGCLGIAVFGFTFGWELEESGAFGVWLGILASIAIAWGGFEAARHELPPRSRRRPAPSSRRPTTRASEAGPSGRRPDSSAEPGPPQA